LQSALSRAPDQGISVPELMAVTGMSRRWVYYRLRELSAAGHVIQTARGLWRIAPKAATVSNHRLVHVHPHARASAPNARTHALHTHMHPSPKVTGTAARDR